MAIASVTGWQPSEISELELDDFDDYLRLAPKYVRAF